MIRPAAPGRVGEAMLRLGCGDFAPKSDPAPTGSVVQGAKGERLVISRCDLSSVYEGAQALATMVTLEPGALSTHARTARPTIVPVMSVSDRPEHEEGRQRGFLDLVRVVSEHWFKPPPCSAPVEASTMAEVRGAVADILQDDPGAGTSVLTEEETAAAEHEDKQLRELGDGRRERRLELVEAESEQTLASELALEALPRVQPLDPFGGLIEWLRALFEPTELLGLVPATVRGEGVVRREGEDETGAEVLAADAGVQIEIAFENRDIAPVWVVVCEQEPDGSLSFVPGEDLATTPRVPPGDALTFNSMPPPDSVVRVAAIALRQPPRGDPAGIASEPGCLHDFGTIL